MRLFLAVAVLMLALIAYTEAQEETIEQQFNKFGQQMSEVGKNLAEKAKSTIEEINNSEFATNTRSWVNGVFEKLRVKFTENTQ